MTYPEDELAARRNRKLRRAPHVADDYESREAATFRREMREAETSPLPGAAEEFYEAMRDTPSLVGERIGWILQGNYGYGAMKAAERVVRNRRMNRAAQLTHMVGALEWKCPLRGATAGWNRLTASEKAALDRSVNAEIEEYEREHGIHPSGGSHRRRR